MHICFIGLEALSVLMNGFENYRTGGEQVQVSLLAKALVKRGFKVSVIVLDYGQASEVCFDGIKIIKAYSPNAGFPVVRFIYPKIIKLWGALKKADADIYYTSCAGFQVGLMAYFCKKNKRKSVFRIASDKDCFPEQLAIKLWRDKRLYEYGLRNQDFLLVQSTQQQIALKKNYNLSSHLAQMLVDSSNRISKNDERDIDILWVNNFRQLKRPDLVIEVAKRLPEFNVHMIGGPNDLALYQKTEREAKTIDNVTFHGPVPYKQVNAFYSRAKILINTSDIEGFPNSYLQSWIRGTPIIVFFDPDNIVSNNELGFKATDVADMCTLIKNALQDPNLWHGLSNKCLDYMSTHFNEDNILKPYLEAFGE
ncbi:MAG TPA: hypothetical protein DCZ48_13950 [Methylococcaceae bacterium]|nr:hypothetical protein [Methylococcaceae bacterium]